MKNLPANAGDTRDIDSIPGSARFPGGRNGNPFQYSCLEKFYGQRSLVDYGPWGYKELDTTEHTTLQSKDKSRKMIYLQKQQVLFWGVQ